MGLWRISLESEFTQFNIVLHVVPLALVRPHSWLRSISILALSLPPLLELTTPFKAHVAGGVSWPFLRLDQYSLILFDTSLRSASPIDFRPRRRIDGRRVLIDEPGPSVGLACCTFSNSDIAQSSFSLSA